MARRAGTAGRADGDGRRGALRRNASDPPAPDGPATGDAEVEDGLVVTRVDDAGPQAPVLLLVHGLGSASTGWALVAPELARDHRLVLVDLPGHGGSPALDAAGAMTPPELGRRLLRLARRCADGGRAVHLLGHSLGGWVVLEAAADDGAGAGADGHRAVVASVTALAPAGLWTRPRRRPPLLPTGQQLARWAGGLPPDVLGTRLVRTLAFTATSAAPRALPPEVARDALAAVAGAPGYAAADAALAAGAFTRAADVRAPVLVVVGARDRILPPRHLRADCAPTQARWVRLERCGHVPAWDRPDDVVRLVREQVARGEEAAGGALGPAGT
ncbi:alpha/beta fold hydrolase [Kineococcus rubinsiae]|uniref:alpha/beta fold hydrolase n=1 Tax=Kineococcus rubinsiae TaxID=2609562 RepID=UPI00142FC09A|nr:alpha/beta fold hydrolase [Kineococcus rubinsiae]NIZ92924.1 alpha/beta fold hydrolase [Kineococcus rubinsiae]